MFRWTLQIFHKKLECISGIFQPTIIQIIFKMSYYTWWRSIACLLYYRDIENVRHNDHSPMTSHEYAAASYVLSLNAEHGLSERAIKEVLNTSRELVTEYLQAYRRECILQNPEQIWNFRNIEMNPFQRLESQYLRQKCYANACNCIQPEEVYLGERVIRTKSGK